MSDAMSKLEQMLAQPLPKKKRPKVVAEEKRRKWARVDGFPNVVLLIPWEHELGDQTLQELHATRLEIGRTAREIREGLTKAEENLG